MLTLRTNSLAPWPKEVPREMSGITCCVCSTSWVFRHIPAAILKSVLSQARERIVIGAMSKWGQDTTSSDSSPVAKARPTNLVMHGQCREDVSPQSSGSRVNPGNDDERKSVSLAKGNWCSSNSNFESRICQVYRQERVIIAARKLEQKDQPPSEKVKRTPPAQRNLMHHHQNWRTWDFRIINTWEGDSNAYKRNWEGLHSMLRSQWSHTKQMEW